MRLVLFPPDVAQRRLPQILHHPRAEGVSDFIDQPRRKLPLRVALRDIIENAAVVGSSRAENKASNVRDGPKEIWLEIHRD